MPKLMMNPMGFRPLEKIANPARRLDVPVIEHFAGGNEERVVSGGSQVAAENSEDNQAGDDRVNKNLNRMFVEGREHLHPAGRMMDLMHRAPEELRFMPISVPPVKDERGEQINGERGTPLVQMFAEMEQGDSSEPAIPSLAGEKSERELDRIDDDDPGPPGPNPGKFHCGPEALYEKRAGRDYEDQENCHGRSVRDSRPPQLIDKYCYKYRLKR